VTMIDALERPDTTEAEVILGVDTHLDFHVAVAVDHLGRRLGESSVQATAKGYEGLLCWAEGFGPLRCAGVALHQQLRCRASPPLEEPGNRGVGGGAPGAPATKLAP
jgi:hypothetical protein